MHPPPIIHDDCTSSLYTELQLRQKARVLWISIHFTHVQLASDHAAGGNAARLVEVVGRKLVDRHGRRVAVSHCRIQLRVQPPNLARKPTQSSNCMYCYRTSLWSPRMLFGGEPTCVSRRMLAIPSLFTSRTHTPSHSATVIDYSTKWATGLSYKIDQNLTVCENHSA